MEHSWYHPEDPGRDYERRVSEAELRELAPVLEAVRNPAGRCGCGRLKGHLGYFSQCRLTYVELPDGRVMQVAGPITGPLCEYWWEQEAHMCGHASCYAIVTTYDALEGQDDIEGYEL